MWNHTQSHPTPAAAAGINNESLSYEQKLQKLLDITPYLHYVEQLFNLPSSGSESSDSESEIPNSMWNAGGWPATSPVGNATERNETGPSEPTSSSSSDSNISFRGSSPPFSSSSTMSSSSSDSELQENGTESFKLPPVSDEELQSLFKVHKMWKKSPYPLGSPADIMPLLNASQSSQRSSCSGATTSSSKSSKGRPSSSSHGQSSKNRSRKQSLKNVRNEENNVAQNSAAAAPAAAATTTDAPTVTETVVKEEPAVVKTEFETLEVKPPVPPPLGNFMEDEEDSGNEEENDNDSLSDYVSMAAAAQTGGGSQILSATKNIVFKNVTSKALPPPSSSTSAPSEVKKKKGVDITKKKISPQKQAKLIEVLNLKRRKVYVLLCKKEIGKTQRARTNNHKENLGIKRRLAQACSRILRQKAIQSQKAMKESVWRAKRLTREMVAYWKQADRVEREVRKRREKEAEEQRKQDVELMEAKRQQRKLNFLITQTELYAHFMSKKLGGTSQDESVILNQLSEEKDNRLARIDDYDSQAMMRKAKQNVEHAFETQQQQVKLFDLDATVQEEFRSDLKLESTDVNGELPQPKMFQGVLKHYQLKGMNWLANLYNQGINGILADEMGLGKTVQSMAFLAHVAERYGVWGPFLVIAPASTLHNWQQEFKRFLPRFKVVPYWGTPQERKILRQFWQPSNLHTEEASFHVVVTSYQIVMTDLKYFTNERRIKWQYLILDEAQAIKSSSSNRWKMLLGFSCRNRLLLTGTPIQNTMAELWALLHFIMPSLFDSHEEFNEWFSKDIESHAENKSLIDEKHLSRLHLILKPFMLRRIKKDVENELSDKIEVLVHCPLTSRQRQLYTALKKKIRIEDLLKSSGPANSQLAQHATTNLMNLVMQFRKVCNHPDLFERRKVQSPHPLPRPVNQFPRLIFREASLHSPVPSKAHLLENRLSVFNPVHIHRRLQGDSTVAGTAGESICSSTSRLNSEWSFVRFAGLSLGEINRIVYGGLREKWKYMLTLRERMENLYHSRTWAKSHSHSPFLSSFDLLLSLKLAPESVRCSPLLQDLVFAKPSSSLYTFMSHRFTRLSPDVNHGKESDLRRMQPTFLPPFLYYTAPKVQGRPRELYFSDRSAAWAEMDAHRFCSAEDYDLVMYGRLGGAPTWHFMTEEVGGLEAMEPVHGWSSVIVPAKEKLITDSGKLGVLDMLLKRLKSNSHRVLIYSQMTKMIDILEEYMWLRKWTYMRLDGSSKISERRDMVADFQSRSDIFVFLLSTRAGGLGINLTAADTVIFYDSDWNPTVDQQAMDRAHRLGQTKQVHVYRLICKGTIEERILQRAREKNEIQRMVISGGNFRPDTLKPKEVVSLLLDDEELERKYRQKQAERRMDDAKVTTDGKGGKESKSASASLQPPLKRKKLTGDRSEGGTHSSGPPSTADSIEESGTQSPSEDDIVGEVEVDTEVVVAETAEDDGSSSSDSVKDEVEPPSPNGQDFIKTIEWNADSVSDYEGEFTVLPKRPKVGRGTGKRGRPPSRVRLPARDTEGTGENAVRRGPGRPRLRPIGPANQGIRGRRPGRPPLTRKPESVPLSLTPLTASQRVFGFYSSPDLDMT